MYGCAPRPIESWSFFAALDGREKTVQMFGSLCIPTGGGRRSENGPKKNVAAPIKLIDALIALLNAVPKLVLGRILNSYLLR